MSLEVWNAKKARPQENEYFRVENEEDVEHLKGTLDSLVRNEKGKKEQQTIN